MPFLFLAPVLAWLLPYIGPLRVIASALCARASRWWPDGTGGLLLVGGCCAILLAAVAWLVAGIVDPAPRTYTKAEIDAARLAAENRSLRTSLDQAQTTLHLRARAIEQMIADNEVLRRTLETSRATSADPDAIVLPADDGWLRAWQKRGR
jgi:hypothetical protein